MVPENTEISPRAAQNKRSFQHISHCLSEKFIDYLADTDRYLPTQPADPPLAVCLTCRAAHQVYDLIPFFEGGPGARRCAGSGHAEDCIYAKTRAKMPLCDNKNGQRNYENHIIRSSTFFHHPLRPLNPNEPVIEEAITKGKYLQDQQIHCFGCSAQYDSDMSCDSIESVLRQHQRDQPGCRYSKIRIKGQVAGLRMPSTRPENKNSRLTLQSSTQPPPPLEQLRSVNTRNNHQPPGLQQAAADSTLLTPEDDPWYQTLIDIGHARDVVWRVVAAAQELDQIYPHDQITLQLLMQKISERKRIAELKHQKQEFEEAKLCKICFDKDQNIVFSPCNHLARIFHKHAPVLACPLPL